MTYANEWKMLSGRIRGLIAAGTLHANFLAVRSSDPFGRAKYLRNQSEKMLCSLQTFRDRFHHVLPANAKEAIEEFISRASELVKLVKNVSETSDSIQEKSWATLVLFAAFESELSFILSNNQIPIRAVSERAFFHLQRLIAIDFEVREKWKDAFSKGEIRCEQLGAVHLLLHGIWAFKVDAVGARTDLVFQEPLTIHTDEQRHIEGLVLTEWKVSRPDDTADKFEEARLQASRYAPGAFSGTELVGYRYAVVVSENQIDTPTDIVDGSVVYRHINIAVDPLTPSRDRSKTKMN